MQTSWSHRSKFLLVPNSPPPPLRLEHPITFNRNAAAWYIGTRHALVKTDSLQPRHPCTCTPQTRKSTQSPQSRDYTQLVHSMCWQSLITPRSRPPLPLNLPLDECIVNTTPYTGTGENKDNQKEIENKESYLKWSKANQSQKRSLEHSKAKRVSP